MDYNVITPKCPNCGASVAVGQTICDFCGTNIVVSHNDSIDPYIPSFPSDDEIYSLALSLYYSADSEASFQKAGELFESLGEYSDSAQLAEECREKQNQYRNEYIYETALRLSQSEKAPELSRAIDLYKLIPKWKDSDKRRESCEEKLNIIVCNDNNLKAHLKAQTLVREKRRKVVAFFVSAIIVCVAGALYIADYTYASITVIYVALIVGALVFVKRVIKRAKIREKK